MLPAPPTPHPRLRAWLRPRRLAILFASAAAALALGAIACDRWVAAAASGRIYFAASDVPARDVGLVLGTSPTTNGRRNLFFTARIEAAADLYRLGKVRHLIVSGDNRRADYDEPTAMLEALIAQGVPASAITRDYAGFRTLDSVVRARDVFGQSRLTIISQEFHDARAIFIAQSHGIDAIGFAARDVGGAHGLLIRTRETLARTKAVLDTKVLGVKPHFPGPPEPIVLP
jgi:SanA protein